MKVWIAKAIVQKAISYMPFKHRINYLFQRYVTKGVLLTDTLMDDKLTHCQTHLQQFFRHRGVQTGYTTLELGTGWYPIVPIGFYLAGADKIFSIDVSDLLETEAIKLTIRRYLQYHQSGKLATFLPQIDTDRLKKLETLLTQNLPPHQLLEQLNIYTILGDARNTKFASDSFDLINSNNTFEHIYPEILLPILVEFKRLLKPNGLMSHFIDMSDHFAHFDKSISVYNYLRFTVQEWSRIDNSVQPQNRLRIYTYRQLHQQAGFKVLEEINRPGSIDELKTVPLAQPFAAHPAADVAITHSLFVSQK